MNIDLVQQIRDLPREDRLNLLRELVKSLARVAVSEVLAVMRVCAVDDAVLRSALALSLADYEDSVQVACALASDLEAIVTRDPGGFVSSPVASIAPTEFVSSWGLCQASLDLN